MPAAKSLDEHVLDRTFRARRHHDLLAGPVVPWPELAALQSRYAAAAHELERRAVAVEFERAVRDRGADADVATLQLELDAILAQAPTPWKPERDRQRSRRAAAANFARDLRNDGLPLRQIATRLGVSPSTVRRYLQRSAA
jgi:AraC-like DNA-binding protein